MRTTKQSKKQAEEEKNIVYLKEYVKEDSKLYFVWLSSNSRGFHRFKIIADNHYQITHLVGGIGIGRYYRGSPVSTAYLSTSSDANWLTESICQKLYGKNARELNVTFQQYA